MEVKYHSCLQIRGEELRQEDKEGDGDENKRRGEEKRQCGAVYR